MLLELTDQVLSRLKSTHDVDIVIFSNDVDEKLANLHGARTLASNFAYIVIVLYDRESGKKLIEEMVCVAVKQSFFGDPIIRKLSSVYMNEDEA